MAPEQKATSIGSTVTLFAVPLSILFWWGWERSKGGKRRSLRLLYQAGEDLAAASSTPEVSRKLTALLPQLARGLTGEVYLYNRSGNSLELVPSGIVPCTVAIRLDGPFTGLGAGLARCFRSREICVEADTRRSPRSVLFLPMIAHGDVVGVMEIHHMTNSYHPGADISSALQHLANLAAAAIRASEQKATRERIFRSEKLSAAGELIAGIAGELQSPLGSILELTRRWGGRGPGSPDPELALIEAEALRGSEIVSRLASFGTAEESEVRPVDLPPLLARLLGTLGQQRVRVETVPGFLSQRILILGVPVQIERAFQELLHFAKAITTTTPDPFISVASSQLAGRVTIAIAYRTPPEDESGARENGGLKVSRGVIQSHGGTLRFLRVSPTERWIEVELPVAEPQLAGRVHAPKRQLTLMLLEAEAKTQRQIRDAIGARGDRLVPLPNAEEAVDLAHQFHFDIVMCSARLPGVNWLDFYERVRTYVDAFILLSQGDDPELVRSFQNDDAHVLSKPVDVASLNRICDSIAEMQSRSLDAGRGT